MPTEEIIRCRLDFYPNVLQIHLKKILTKQRLEEFHGEDCLCQFDLNQPAVVKNLFRIEGVEQISLSRYTIHLEKGNAFEWPDLIIPIFSALLSSLSEDPFSASIAQIKAPTKYILNSKDNQWYTYPAQFPIPNPYRLPEKKQQET